MSRKCKNKYNQHNGFPMAFIFIILVLIVLQWFKTGNSTAPEQNLVNNGGLFIIALFFLVTCSCQSYYPSYGCNYCRK